MSKIFLPSFNIARVTAMCPIICPNIWGHFGHILVEFIKKWDLQYNRDGSTVCVWLATEYLEAGVGHTRHHLFTPGISWSHLITAGHAFWYQLVIPGTMHQLVTVV